MMLILLILSLVAFATAEVNFLLAFLKVIIAIISRLRTRTSCSRLTFCSSVQCRPWMVCASLDLSRLFTTIAFIIVFHVIVFMKIMIIIGNAICSGKGGDRHQEDPWLPHWRGVPHSWGSPSTSSHCHQRLKKHHHHHVCRLRSWWCGQTSEW